MFPGVPANGSTFPVRDPWDLARPTLCAGLQHCDIPCLLRSLFPITPTGGNSQSEGTATPKPLGPAWPGTSDPARDNTARLLQPLLLPRPSSLKSWLSPVLGSWSVAGVTKEPLPICECVEVRCQHPFCRWEHLRYNQAFSATFQGHGTKSSLPEVSGAMPGIRVVTCLSISAATPGSPSEMPGELGNTSPIIKLDKALP